MAAMLSSAATLAPGARVLSRTQTQRQSQRHVTRVVAAAKSSENESLGAIVKPTVLGSTIAAALPAIADEIETPAAESAVDVTIAAADAAADATAAATAAAADAANAAVNAAGAAADAASQAASQASSQASDAAAALAAKFGGLGGSASDLFGGATKQLGGLGGSASDALGGATSKLGGAASTLGGAASGAAKTAAPVLGATAKAIGEGAGGAAKVLGEGSAKLGAGFGAASNAASQASNQVSSSVNQATSTVTAAGSSAAQALESALPPEFVDVIALAKMDSDVAIALAVTLITAPVLLSSVINSIRGYTGDVNAFVLDEQLMKDKRAFLIDTRGEETRLTDGVPDLRGAARSRGAAVEVTRLDESVRKRTSDVRGLELEIAAKKVAVLTRGNANVYVLGPDASALAKTICKKLSGNRKAFVVSSGFEGWRSGGLKVRSNGRYEKNALDVVGEETSTAAAAFTRKVSAAAGTARTSITEKDPSELVPFVLGLVGLSAAVVNYETTLQFLGVLGIELTVLNKVLSYSSPFALLEDLKDSAMGLADAASKLDLPEANALAKPNSPAMRKDPVPAKAPGVWPPVGANFEKKAEEKVEKKETPAPVAEKKVEEKKVVEEKVPEVKAAKVEEKVEEKEEKKEEKPVSEDGSVTFKFDAEEPLPEEKVEQKKDM